MRTIVVPTDFSEAADSALDYSVNLARETGAKLTLLHAHHLPIFNNENNEQKSQDDPEPDFEEVNRQSLQSLAQEISANNRDVDLESFFKIGAIADIILKTAEENDADLITIGLSKSGLLDKSVLDGHATEAIKRAVTPVLIVPFKTKFKSPTKVLFATDYVELKSDYPIDTLIDFVNHFKAHVYIVNVMKENEKISSKKAASIDNIKKMMKRVDHSFHYPINENVIDGINKFASESGIEMIIMIPHKHNIFYRLFNLSNTKKMTSHSNVPLLIIPENTASNIANGELVENNGFAFSSFKLALPEFG
jgi:nucleotide-binding universal stress UspA family protein